MKQSLSSDPWASPLASLRFPQTWSHVARLLDVKKIRGLLTEWEFENIGCAIVVYIDASEQKKFLSIRWLNGFVHDLVAPSGCGEVVVDSYWYPDFRGNAQQMEIVKSDVS